MEENKTFLGTGWSFPPTFEKSGKNTVSMVSNELDIKQSIEIILNTAVGERINQPDFGANMDDLVFESISGTMIGTLISRINTSLGLYEPRIELEEVSLDRDQSNEGVLLVIIDYTIIAANRRDNIVFPFFLNEGTDIA